MAARAIHFMGFEYAPFCVAAAEWARGTFLVAPDWDKVTCKRCWTLRARRQAAVAEKATRDE